MKYYELSYLTDSELNEEQVSALNETAQQHIREMGGVLANSTNRPARIVLAYPIKDKAAAYINSIGFDFDPQKIDALKQKILAEKDVLRFMLVTKKPPKKTTKVHKRKDVAEEGIISSLSPQIKELSADQKPDSAVNGKTTEPTEQIAFEEKIEKEKEEKHEKKTEKKVELKELDQQLKEIFNE